MEFDSLVLPSANIKKLYIKLDKKLIVKADYIAVKKNYQKSSTKEQLLSLKNYLKFFYELFNEIEIKKLKYQNQLFSIKYKRKNFYLESNDIFIQTTIALQNRETVKLDAKKIYLKKYNSLFKGKVNIAFLDNKVEFDGVFQLYNLNGKIKFTLQNNLLRYYIYDVSTNNLAPFMEYLQSIIKIKKVVSNWIYRYIIAKHYYLSYLYGVYNIKSDKFYPSLINGEATAKDVTIKFHKSLDIVKVKRLKIGLKNNTLHFNFSSPFYKKIALSGSTVTINKIFTKGTNINITILATHPLDEKINEILKAYKVSIPLRQSNGKTKAKIVINIHFVPYSLDIKGNFLVNESDIYFKNIKFHTKKAHIKVDNNKITLINSNISYKDLFDLNSSGIFKTDTNIYKGRINISKLFLKYKNERLLDSNKSKSSILIDFNKGEIFLKDLDSKMSFKKEKNNFLFYSLKKIENLSPLIKKYHIFDGNIKVLTKNFKKFFIDGIIKLKDQNIVLYKNMPLKDFSINAEVDDKKILLNIDKNLIKMKIDKNIEVKSNNISYSLVNSLQNHSKTLSLDKTVILDANNSTLFITKKLTLPTESFTLFVTKGKTIFSSEYQKNQIFYEKDRDIVKIYTNELNVDYFDKLLGYKLFHNGKISLKIKEQNSTFEGVSFLTNTIIKSSKKGGNDYKIDRGRFEFMLKNHLLTLKNIILKNRYSTLKGGGYIDTKNRSIYIKLKVAVLKNLSKTIKSIPLIGYIVLGKNGKFTSTVTISGNIDKPTIKTDFAKDVAKSPLKIFLRVLKLPFNLFNPSK